MRLDTLSTNDVESFGDKTTLTFGIDVENMGLVYKSFLNYSDAIGSVVREYTSNCFDSHSEANVDKPVIVTFNPRNYITNTPASIEFKDVGVGLSPERIQNVFCKFFTSTKRDSNQFIGAYGIGAKSALGYTNMFTIVTRYNTVEYVYVVHLGEVSPVMDLVDSYFTGEPNGTIIKIDIKEGDEFKFKEAINQQLKYFDNIQFEGVNVGKYSLIRGKNFIINTERTQELEICYGKIKYTLDNTLVNINELYSEIVTEDKRFTKNLYAGKGLFPFALYFDIGEIEVVWNREAVNYTNKTVEAIKNKFREALMEIADLYDEQKEKVDSLDTLYELSKKVGNDKDTVVKIQEHVLKSRFLSGKIVYCGLELKDVNLIVNNYFFKYHQRYFCNSNTSSNALKHHITPRKLLHSLLNVSFHIVYVIDRIDKKKLFTHARRNGITGDLHVLKPVFHGSNRISVATRYTEIDIQEVEKLYSKLCKLYTKIDDIKLTEKELDTYKEENIVYKKYANSGLFLDVFEYSNWRNKYTLDWLTSKTQNKKITAVYCYKDEFDLMRKIARHVTCINDTNYFFFSVAKSNYDILEDLEAIHINEFINTHTKVLNRFSQRYWDSKHLYETLKAAYGLSGGIVTFYEYQRLQETFSKWDLPEINIKESVLFQRVISKTRGESLELFIETPPSPKVLAMRNRVEAVSNLFSLTDVLFPLYTKKDYKTKKQQEVYNYFHKYDNFNLDLLWRAIQKSSLQETTTL